MLCALHCCEHPFYSGYQHLAWFLHKGDKGLNYRYYRDRWLCYLQLSFKYLLQILPPLLEGGIHICTDLHLTCAQFVEFCISTASAQALPLSLVDWLLAGPLFLFSYSLFLPVGRMKLCSQVISSRLSPCGNCFNQFLWATRSHRMCKIYRSYQIEKLPCVNL